MAQSKFIQSVVKAAQGRPRSTDWYREKIKEFGKPGAMDLIRDGKRDNEPFFGRLNMFFYDPKYKKKLPYYDTFPLVLPLEPMRGGFIGLNFHYLPYGARFKFLQQLQTYASNGKFDQSTKIQASYNSIKSNKYTKVAIKRYLYSHVRSNFLRINVDEMALAAYLPVAQFTGKTIGGVFAAARRNF